MCTKMFNFNLEPAEIIIQVTERGRSNHMMISSWLNEAMYKLKAYVLMILIIDIHITTSMLHHR